MRNGHGEYTWASNGAKFTGAYINNKREGLGTMYYPDKTVYTGEWKNNKRNGHGTYTYANGDKYCGQWVDDQKQGEGVYLMKSTQTQITGQWEKGICNDGLWEFFDDSPFHGVFTNNIVKCYFGDPTEALESLMKKLKEVQTTKASLLDGLFTALDEESTGTLSTQELFHLIKVLDFSYTLEQFHSNFGSIPINKERVVERKDFIQIGIRFSSSAVDDFALLIRLMTAAKKWMKSFVEEKDRTNSTDFPDLPSIDSLSLACRLGSLAAAQRIVQEQKINFSNLPLDRNGKTPLMYACQGGHLKLIRYILSVGALWGSRCFYLTNEADVRSLLQKEFAKQKVVEKKLSDEEMSEEGSRT
eukprot:TRINITY_DN2858_c0_g1_i1.p1 TRINITY_DN2858_c0_g1~~TRINITY_DN2858_c0_g1_i1.p1  ORF type:complete len:358 (-),score=83.99 TRINITY_DN2858_c0_g1_i1:87-1160(-)